MFDLIIKTGWLSKSICCLFFILIFQFLYIFHFSGKKVDSDADTTGEEDVFSKVTLTYISVVNVCCNSVAFLSLPCIAKLYCYKRKTQ